MVDEAYFGPEGVTNADRLYAGSRFSEVRAAIFANPYIPVWGAAGAPPLPRHTVTLSRALSGVLPFGERWHFLEAAKRAVDSRADLRWGADGKGFRRILHPNSVCLTGTWEIDAAPAAAAYTGYFKPGSRALVIARYSTCCAETRRGHNRSQSLVGKLYPTLDPDHREPLRPASFITQEDLGGTAATHINDVELRNAPDTTPLRRGAGLATFMVTGIVLTLSDKEPTIRQLYEIAELGKPDNEATRAPEFMRLTVDAAQPRIDGADLDFRDEVLGQIYDKGNREPRRTLAFTIEVSDEGRTEGRLVQRRIITNWKRIGRIVFREAVASYNGDFVLHFHHPHWRNDRNDPATVARPR
jgi:hypothetical protein